jgi:hypothetical protein
VHSARSAKTLIDYSKQSNWVDSCDTHLSSKHRGKIWVAYPMMMGQFQNDSDIATQEQIEESKQNFKNTKQCLDHFVKVITTKPAFTLTNPEISLYKDFLTAEECQELIDGAKDRLTKSQVVNSETKENMDHQGRTSSGTHYTVGQTLLIEKIEQHISHITGIPIENGEGIQILKYEPHQEYLPHYDYFDGIHDNQRVATFIMYLNTPIEGGQTVFPNANISVSAQMGSGLLFKYPNQDINSLHGGSPVLQGEKWIATKWIRKERL